jgi:AraC-like DNA-binding protein
MPGSKTKNHILLFVTAGTMIYTVEETAYRMEKKDILLVPKGVFRSARNLPDGGHDMYVFHFRCEGANEELPILSNGSPNMVKTSQFDYMKQRFSLITQHWLKKSPYSENICYYALMEVLCHLNEEIDSQKEYGKPYSHVVQMQNFILQHYQRPISITELADVIDRTPNYVSTIFRQVTGRTVSEYIQQIRITAACDLLANSQMTVNEVSDYLGYCEPSYFNKVFKRVTGTSPSKYMKEQVRFWRR